MIKCWQIIWRKQVQRIQKSEMILVVEDNPEVRAYICEQLYEDFDIIEGSNGEEGFFIAQKELPDLIITDVMMPDGDGLELVPSLQRIRPELKIIVISAQNSLSTSAKANELGVFGYLPKPFDLKELTKLVNAALNDNSGNEDKENQQKLKLDLR